MLQSLDVLIGFSVIMLLVSVLITVATQTISTLLQMRGKMLCTGLQTLLGQVGGKKLEPHAAEIAAAVLRHPLVSGLNGSMGQVIQREELTRILLELATGQGSGISRLGAEARTALESALCDSGLASCEEALRGIERAALRLEAAQPALATHIRQNMAIIESAACDFVARLHSWFDESMDRVSGAFAAKVRVVTVVASLFLSMFLQLDSFRILRQLSSNDKLRQQASALAETAGQAYQRALRQETGAPNALAEELRQGRELVAQAESLSASGFALVPAAFDGLWWLDPKRVREIPGVLLSTILLSFGAPFWFNALQSLVRLRPALAAKEAGQREERQQTQS